MGNLTELIYWYCTDFCVNAANLLDISYVEFNTWLFLVLLPSLVLVLLVLNVWRYLVKPWFPSKN